jgi:hypothetical protein
VSAPSTLVADSAALDRSCIPALMLSDGKDPAKALAGDEAAMTRRARQLFPLLLDG